jgi:hypothetical protein
MLSIRRLVRVEEMNNPDAQFKTCTSAYNCLREMACRIEQADGSGGDWRILFEDGLRGFAARISTVTESLCLLDQPFQIPAGELSPEQWAIDTDKRIGEIFFGMDSAIECFVFALNAVGYLKSPSKFCDITTASGLKRIRPDNIACCNPNHKNPFPGYSEIFPRVVAHWTAHLTLIAEITDFHDVSKHRSCIVHTSSPGCHALPSQPKSPKSLTRTSTRTVENIAKDFHSFCESLLIETVEEISSIFNIPIGRIDHTLRAR